MFVHTMYVFTYSVYLPMFWTRYTKYTCLLEIFFFCMTITRYKYIHQQNHITIKKVLMDSHQSWKNTYRFRSWSNLKDRFILIFIKKMSFCLCQSFFYPSLNCLHFNSFVILLQHDSLVFESFFVVTLMVELTPYLDVGF